MQILSLDLDNVKSYEKAYIDFTLGTNAIVGHNGAGKSTILEAIGFTLFDSLGYRQDDFVREGQKTATITVTFVSSADERPYQIVRRCGSSSAYYVQDPETGLRICEGKADVVSFLKQHLGVEVGADLTHIFEEAVGVPQGKLTAAFLERPTQRKNVFDALLQVEEYRQAADKLREPQRHLRDKVQELDVALAGYTARLERLPALASAIQQRSTEIDAGQKQARALGEQLQAVETQRAALEAAQQEVSKLQAQQGQLAQQVEALSRQLDTAHAAYTEAEQAVAIIEQNQAGADAYRVAQAQRRELEAQQQARTRLEQQLSELDKTRALLRAELSTAQQNLVEAETAQRAADALDPAVAQQDTLEQALSAVQQQVARLADAERHATEQQAQLATLQSRQQQLTEQLAKATELEATQEQANQVLADMRRGMDDQRQAQANCQAEAETIKQQTQALEAVETALCPVCEQPLPEEKRADLLARNQTRLEELRATFRQAQQTLKQSENAVATRQDELEHLTRQLRQLPRADEVEQVAKEIDARQQAVQMAQTQLDALADAPTRQTAISQQLAELDNPRQRAAILLESARRRATLMQQVTQHTDTIAAHEADLTTLQETLAQFASVGDGLAAAVKAMQEHEAAYQAVLANQQVANALAARHTAVDNVAQQVRDAEQAQVAVAAARAQAESNFDADEFAAVTEVAQQLRSQQASLTTQLTMLEQAQQRDNADFATLQSQQQEMAVAEEERAQLQAQDELLKTVRDVLRQAGPFITRALVRQISSGAAQVFGDIMQDYTRHLAWTEDYGITLEVDGRARQFAQLSGGEQMSAALAVRLALLREMSSIDFAFFDEPTTNLDEARRQSLARQILDVKGFRQLFVISHDDTFEQATQNVVRVTRAGGQSVVQDI